MISSVFAFHCVCCDVFFLVECDKLQITNKLHHLPDARQNPYLTLTLMDDAGGDKRWL